MKPKLMKVVFEFADNYKVSYRSIPTPEGKGTFRNYFEVAVTHNGKGRYWTISHFPNKTNALILIHSTFLNNKKS